MGRAHFCCCLPVRLGALLISLGQVVCSGCVAGGLWYILLEKSVYFGGSKPLKIAAIVLAVIQSINTLVSLLALWGTIRNKLSLLLPFIRIYAWELGVNIVFSVLYIVMVFTRSSTSLADACAAGSTNQNVIDSCKSQANASKIGTTISLVVSLLWQSYFLWIVSQYADQLQEKENRSHTMSMNAPAFKYVQAGRNSEDAFTAPEVHYPYSDGKNAFGHGRV